MENGFCVPVFQNFYQFKDSRQRQTKLVLKNILIILVLLVIGIQSDYTNTSYSTNEDECFVGDADTQEVYVDFTSKIVLNGKYCFSSYL